MEQLQSNEHGNFRNIEKRKYLTKQMEFIAFVKTCHSWKQLVWTSSLCFLFSNLSSLDIDLQLNHQLNSIFCQLDTDSYYSFFLVGNVQKFPRISVWDPYRRLGVSYDASVEELWGSRNFLLQQYAGHERSEEAIEAAFEKILMASFRQRKKTKINLKSRLKKKVEESPPWVQNLLNYVELPATDIILRRLFLFAFMGAGVS